MSPLPTGEIPRPLLIEQVLRSLSAIVREYIGAAIARNSVYQETGAYQFAVRAAHMARHEYPALKEGE